MQLSVIILNYNVRYFLEQCVSSVQKALETIDGEVIVIDNNSSDDSCEMMKTRFPNVKLIENNQNLGFPKGNNIGVAEAKGEYICILNPDTVVSEDTFTKILKTENWQKNTGIIGCKLIDGTGNFLPESKRGVPTPWVAFTKIFGLYKFFSKISWFNQYYAQHITENESGKVDILVGAFMMMKKSLYLELGGFDEECFMYSDDIDLSYMVLQKGFQNYYHHETTVIHYKGESTVRDGTYMKRFSEAMQFFYKKHFKKSFFFDVMMQFGSLFFALLKKHQQKEIIVKIDSYVVFTKKKMNLQLGKPVSYLTSLELFKVMKGKNVEIIFDVDDFSYQEIINFMQLNKSKNITYKNFFPSSNFMIGSYSSNDRGGSYIALK
ncbi:glycosyltransferase family 2 protein [Flavobacterium jejuense]|uniref:Glycosyltransferase family 2 protein n=1 Tax=Flavobacterium jejuense TaxID=1544455 RepID=A0ABX0ING4_9FLAO|nr:glycosyltransferase family 2 protein [Flavobacterium jejuense]NHN25128.1 glycosyltransferase family 2 protein [Flavobacterium jejuense]